MDTPRNTPGEAEKPPLRPPSVLWRLGAVNLLHLAAISVCLADMVLLLQLHAAATVTWDTVHYMLSYRGGRFNELMTLAVPLIPRLFWWIEPDIGAYRLLRYAVSIVLGLGLGLSLWRFVLRQAERRPLDGIEVLAWSLTLLLSCFLGNAMLIQFWPLGHHDLTSWLYMATAMLLIWSLAGGRPAGKAVCVILGALCGVQLFVKIPCFGGLVVVFVLYVLLFAQGRRLRCLGLYGLGFLGILAACVALVAPVGDILAAVESSRIRFSGAYGGSPTSPVAIVLRQLGDLGVFLWEFLRYYGPALGGCALLVALAGRWRHRWQGRLARPARALLPVVVTAPLWVTMVLVLGAATMDPSLIESLGLPHFPQRYGMLSNYGLPLAEYILLYLGVCLLDRLINRMPDPDQNGRSLFVALVLSATPFFMAVGSSQAIMHYIQEGVWGFVALALFGLFLLRRPMVGNRSFHLIILCLFLVVQQYKYTTWVSYNICLDKQLNGQGRNLFVPVNECATPPLLQYNTPVPTMRHGRYLLFTSEQAAFYKNLEAMLRQAGFRDGDNIIGFYGLGEPVYFLGGRSPGTPIYYPDNMFGPHFNARMLALASPEEVRSSFFLINEPLTSEILDVLQRDGLSLEKDYSLVGSLPQPDCLNIECYKSDENTKYTVFVYAPKSAGRPAIEEKKESP